MDARAGAESEEGTMNAQLILTVLALICFFLGVIDYAPLNSNRMIAAGLALITLAQLVGAR